MSVGRAILAILTCAWVVVALYAAAQMLNIDLFQPSLSFLNGGQLPSFAAPFPGPFSLSFNTPPFPLTISIQMAILNTASPIGVSFSQGCQLVVQ